MFSKLLVYLCQVSKDDGLYPIIGPDSVEILLSEVPENGRHLQQHFHVFLAYAMKGSREVAMC